MPEVQCDRCQLPGSWRNEDRRLPRLSPVLVEDLDLAMFVKPPVLLCAECIRWCREGEDRRLEVIDWTDFLSMTHG